MADTLRVDVCYRPLRIGWAIREGDFAAFREAVEHSYALWGGRYGPILTVEHEEEAKRLVELFRVDMIWPVGDSQEVRDFPKKFPHLITPLHGNAILSKDLTGRSHSQVLDVYNALVHWHKKPEWKNIIGKEFSLFTWQPDDPLADVLLLQIGAYPPPESIGTDYRELLRDVADAKENAFDRNSRLPVGIVTYPGIPFLNRLGISRHYNVRSGWDMAGFFVGSATDFRDLVCCWNLRACDIPLLFVDPAHIERYADLVPAWERVMRDRVADRVNEWDRELGVWSRHDIDAAAGHFPEMRLVRCQMHVDYWSGGSVRAPFMHLGTSATLGVIGESNGAPRVNFALAEKPFASDPKFFSQHLVASVSSIGTLYSDEDHTFDVPYVPELNEVFARAMHFQFDKLRVEPNGVGLVIEATDHNTFLKAMPVSGLMQEVFALAGFDSVLSSGGRILRQLITQLGGVQGARVFKIPGARKLLKKFGPRDTFSLEVAVETIKDKVPGQNATTFSSHVRLFLEPRPHHVALTPPDVFTFMVGKGLFRIGVDLDCPKCGMKSWVALDVLKQRSACELCGHEYDAARQLVGMGWRFRRSGVLGAERNAQGAVPVALALQQLDTNLGGPSRSSVYSASLELMSKGNKSALPCEVDFVWIGCESSEGKPVIILGECKDQGPIKHDEFKGAVENLRRVADAIPRHAFQTYVLVTKLAPFTPEEIATARTLNAGDQPRVILLTARELEPYPIFDRTKEDHPEIQSYGGSAVALARVTEQIYFGDPAPENARPATGTDE